MAGKENDKNLLKIGQLAKAAHIPLSTIRYYTDIGLLKVASRTKGGYRLYDGEDTLGIIRKIKPVMERRRTLIQIRDDLIRRSSGAKLRVEK